MSASSRRKVALVAAHFVPSNLAAVHRTRLWSLHLSEFGWEPVIVTTHWDYYEEKPEFELMALVPPDLEVIRTRAVPTRPLRIVGDVGVRALPWHYRALTDLARKRAVDFVHVTIPSNFSALLGRLVARKTGVPYGIDYIDPWADKGATSARPFSKGWFSARLGERLEPWAVRDASLITGINRLYFEGMLTRNPHLESQAVLAEMPYGGSNQDHERARALGTRARLFDAHAGKFNLIYAGAMLPEAYAVLDCLLHAIAVLLQRRPALAQEFHLHFVGTGRSPTDAAGFNVRPYIERHGVGACVSEHPQRLPYLEILAHLEAASGVLILGSTQPHYSPSKVFQAILSRRPVFALLHRRSSAVPLIAQANAGAVVELEPQSLPPPQALAVALERFVYANEYRAGAVDWTVLEQHSARESARRLAAALDEAMARHGARLARGA